jgi:beta-glucosidase
MGTDDGVLCGDETPAMRITRKFPLGRMLFVLVLVAIGCGDGEDHVAASTPTQAIEARVADLLARMTLSEKVEQMHGTMLSQAPDGTWHTADNDRLGIPGFHMVDGPRGVSKSTGIVTSFPVGSARGATFDPDLEVQVGRAIGEEARAKGANVILAPVINLLRQPQWGRAQETYGEDPVHLGAMGSAFIRGAQDEVISSAKHFALYSIEDTRFRVNVTVDERTLREVYLPHFKKAVDAGVGSIMSAYNKVNGLYCSENPHLLHDILMGEWGFTGFVESDWILGTHSTVGAALAGLDIEMPSPLYFGDPLIAAVNDDSVPEANIDEAVRRILRAKLRFGIIDGLPATDASVIESPAHTALALQTEQEAIVLLKNDGGALPLQRTALGSIAVVGVLADTVNTGDAVGSSATVSSYTITPLAGMRNRAGAVRVIGVATDSPAAPDWAQIEAADAAIVVVGLTTADESEGPTPGDRTTLELAAAPQQLIHDVAAHNARTIVVLEGGSAITMEGWVDEVAAIAMAWYPGLEGGNAIADVLFGDVDPSGKLPVTFPRSADQLPPFNYTIPAVTYGYYHGYRYVDHNGFEPRYPFGFGLSYTAFAFDELTLAESTIRPDGVLHAGVAVTNTGTVDGDEVVQLYVSYEGSAVDRPVRELKAFQRVHLNAGETKTVALDVAANDLAYWDVDTAAWKIEDIQYVAQVGDSSRDLPLTAQFRIAAP